jgi:hypothetical protein
MSASEIAEYETSRIEPADVASGFRCGKHPLDDFFARHALGNDRAGICRAYVLRRREADTLPAFRPCSASTRSAWPA